MLLSASRSHLVVVDLQERLMPAIHDRERVARNARILLTAAGRLGVPVTVTEQYPSGLGRTVAPVREALPEGARVVEKVHFSGAAEPAVSQVIAAQREQGRDQLVVCGTEAHVCVLQTALGLRAGHDAVYVVSDAISSRSPHSVEVARSRMSQAGCDLVTTEMVVFEWLERAGTDMFRALSALIK
jgi:nicotinamidase-related amidase